MPMEQKELQEGQELSPKYPIGWATTRPSTYSDIIVAGKVERTISVEETQNGRKKKKVVDTKVEDLTEEELEELNALFTKSLLNQIANLKEQLAYCGKEFELGWVKLDVELDGLDDEQKKFFEGQCDKVRKTLTDTNGENEDEKPKLTLKRKKKK